VSETMQDLENSLNRLRERYAQAVQENALSKAKVEQLTKAGASLSKETMVVMLNGGAHDELIKAHDEWKDLVDGKPNWGTTCKK
jgi:IS5 family transposase